MYYDIFKRNIEGKVYEDRRAAWDVLKRGLYSTDITQAQHDELADLVNTVYLAVDEAPEWHETVTQLMTDHIALVDRVAALEARLDGGGIPPEPEPDDDFPQWEMPEPGKYDKYGAGAKVYHNGRRWISKVDSNVWEPSMDNWAAWDIAQGEANEKNEE